MKHSRPQTGATLIEVITVMVIVAIIAAMGSGFVASTLDSYTQTQERAKLLNRGRQAIEQITRQLRGAAPNSVRVTNGGNCIEFLPLAAAGNYLAPVPDVSNGAAASNQITTAPFNLDFGAAQYATIGARVPGDLYGGGSLAILDTSASGLLQLTAAKIWDRNSATRRFFLVSNPRAFCLAAGNLLLHENYATPLTTTGTPGNAGILMAEDITSTNPFSVDAGSETRGAVAVIDLVFNENAQRLPLRQEVFVRNVP